MAVQKRLVEPFWFPGNHVGCLLIHGFSGSPSEMRLLGERLSELGWTVLGIRLSGHGTTPEQMAKTRWEDWAKDAEAGVEELRKSCDTVVAIGLSMGGLLALHLATLGLPDGIIVMNAPMILADRRSPYVRLIKPFTTFVKPKVSDTKAERFSYERIPVDALISLNSAIRQVHRKLVKISCPVLLMQSTKDLTVDPVSVQIILKEIRHVKPVVLYWEKSGHILTMGPEREAVVFKVNEFLKGIELRR
ncbi:MAG: alpha/beta fold hydrolase [Bacillota bacterium]|nr:alpha/beta fold hydrolase [Bacillota bacterium]